jgi:hypothetical protein
MENLSRLVSDSLAQNGVSIALNHQRLEWSRWFRCESSFSVLLAPSKPGIFALGEEIIAPDSLVWDSRDLSSTGKRMLALFEVLETDDLGLSLGRLFLPRNPLREKLEYGRCFARFTVIEDAAERASAHAALRSWMDQSAETASGLTSRDQNEPCGADTLVRDYPENTLAGGLGSEASQPSFAFPWGMEPPRRELQGKVVDPTPLPSGF